MNIQVGDKIHVELEVLAYKHDKYLYFRYGAGTFYIDINKVTVIEHVPAALKVGDRVTNSSYTDHFGNGNIISFFEEVAWVKFDKFKVPSIMALKSLERAE